MFCARSLFTKAYLILAGTVPLLIAAPSLARVTDPIQFPDTSSHWARDCIAGAGQDELMKGYLDGRFRPDGTMTRAEFAAVIVKAFPNAPAMREAPNFSDVSPDFWGREAIRAAYERGFLAGYPGNLFRPEQAISRVQAMTIVANTQARADVSSSSDEAVLTRFFEDAIAIPPYARSAIASATRSSLVVNYPNPNQLEPNNSITRGEAAALLCRINADGSDARYYVPADYVAAFGYRFDNRGLPVAARPEPTLLQEFDLALGELSLERSVEIGGRLYLIDSARADVWVTDGTSAGTRLVESLQSTLESDSASDASNELAVGTSAARVVGVGDERFWVLTQHGALDPTTRAGLWSSDGTTGGTREVADFSPRLAEAIAQSHVRANGSPTRAFKGRLPVIVENQTGSELWITDGQSEAGTERLATSTTETSDGYTFLRELATTDDYLFFIKGSYNPDRVTLWRTDGTLEGTQAVEELDEFDVHQSALSWKNRLYFMHHTSETGSELWTSDGTSAGTRLFKDIYPGTGSAEVRIIGDREGTLFMLANSPEGLGLWATEGTPESMRLVKLLTTDRRTTGSFMYPTATRQSANGFLYPTENGRFFFRAAASADSGGRSDLYDMWVSDGTEGGTQLVEAGLDSNLVEGVGWNDQLFFANRNADGEELWVSDGTQSGTRYLVDLSPGFINVLNFCSLSEPGGCPAQKWWPNDTQPRNFTATDDFLYFIDRENRLFRTDGTVRGMELVHVLNERYEASYNLTLLGETVLFASDRADADSPTGNRLRLFSIIND